MPFYKSEDGAGRELFEGVNAHIHWGEKIMTMVVDVAANRIVPSHSHPHEQAGIVLEGEIRFTIGDETQLLRTGDIYMIPSNVEHSAEAGAEACKVLDIFSPPRADLQDE